MENSKILWTDDTFNVVVGCKKVSAGCANCYMETQTKRYGYKGIWGKDAERHILRAEYWKKPLKWNREAGTAGKRRRVFCGSWCDVFEDHPTVTQERTRLWELIRKTPNLDWMLLTKRSDRIASNLPEDWGTTGYPNVWLGVTVENADYVNRVDDLRKIPAVVRFVSYEPALGPLSDSISLEGIHWVIYGGESGPHFRPHRIEWATTMRDKCHAEGVAFFYKQGSHRFNGRDTFLDGKEYHEFPKGEMKSVSLPKMAKRLLKGLPKLSETKVMPLMSQFRVPVILKAVLNINATSKQEAIRKMDSQLFAEIGLRTILGADERGDHDETVYKDFVAWDLDPNQGMQE